MKIREYISELDKAINIECALSTLDHTLTQMSKGERYSALIAVIESDLGGLDLDTKIFIAGMIEHACNESGKEAPQWVMSKQYSYDDVMECTVAKELLNSFKAIGAKDMDEVKSYIPIELANSLPAFRWRNMLCDGIFDSY